MKKKIWETTSSPAQLCEDGRYGVRPALDGPDGVPAAAAGQEKAARLGPLPLLAATAAAAAAAVAAAVAAVVARDRLGLEHDGALGLVHQAELAEPEAHRIPAKKERKIINSSFKYGISGKSAVAQLFIYF